MPALGDTETGFHQFENRHIHTQTHTHGHVGTLVSSHRPTAAGQVMQKAAEVMSKTEDAGFGNK